MTWEIFRRIVPILCTIPVAYLSFVSHFKNELHKQLKALKDNYPINWHPVDITTDTWIYKPIDASGKTEYKKDIRIDYRIGAFFLFGINNYNWIDIFDPTTKIAMRLERDKSAAVRNFIWACFSFVGFISLAVIK